MTYSTIQLESEGPIARIWLNRPEVRNAFNSVMIRELGAAIEAVAKSDSLRVLVLSGRGDSFCAGADLNWMREVVRFSFEQNLEESLQLAELLHRLFTLPKPTIARVNGPAIGGGVGLVAACDIVVASEAARFGLSEVKLGLVPAVISPYVLRRIGVSRTREYFLTGERFEARRALEIELANAVAAPQALDEKVREIIERLLSSGPVASARCKELIARVSGLSLEEAKPYTARMIAELRVSEEGQEGMAAFLEKRKARWVEP